MIRKRRDQSRSEIVPPTPTHVHHHTPSEVGPIVAKAAIGLLAVLLAWFIGLYLLGKMGVRDPEAVLARLIVWGLLIVALVFLLNHWLSGYLDRYYVHREAIEKEKTQQARYRQVMTQSAVVDTRREGEGKRLASLIYVIMLDVYDDVAKKGPYKGSWRPWSRRAAGERVLVTMGETEPVGPEFGAKVRRFLEHHEIIINDQLNLGQYPDIASVQRVLYQPILLNRPNQPTLPKQIGD